MAAAGNLDREHHRVVANMLGFVLELFVQFDNVESLIRPHLESLLPDFICTMAHAKEAVRNLAADVLEYFVGQYAFGDLLPSIERVLGSSNSRSQEVGLVVLMDCLTVAASQPGTLQQTAVSQILKRVLSLPKSSLRTNAQIAEVARDVLAKVFEEPATAGMARNAAHRLSKSQLETLQRLLPNNNFFEDQQHHQPHTNHNHTNPRFNNANTALSSGNTSSTATTTTTTSAPTQATAQPNITASTDQYNAATTELLRNLYFAHTNRIDGSTAATCIAASLASLDSGEPMYNNNGTDNAAQQFAEQEVALHLLRKVAEVQPATFVSGHLEAAVVSVLGFFGACGNNLDTKLVNLVHRCVAEIAGLMEPVECIQFLREVCFSPSIAASQRSNGQGRDATAMDADQQLYMFLFCIRGVLIRCHRQRLNSITASILPRLVEGACHAGRSDIRKCAIVALAELSVVLGALVETSLAQTWNGRRLSDVHFQLIWHFSQRFTNGVEDKNGSEVRNESTVAGVERESHTPQYDVNSQDYFSQHQQQRRMIPQH